MAISPFRIPMLSGLLGQISSTLPRIGLPICGARAYSRILNYDQSGRIYVLPYRKGRPSGVRLVSVLSELKVGETGVVETLDLPEAVQNYLMHLGFLPDALVMVLRRAPAGDPTVYGVDGMEIALRHETASAIRVHQTDDATASRAVQEAGVSEVETSHPALQESPAPAELAEVAQ